MKINFKSLAFSLTLFLLPLAQFTKENSKLLDFNTFGNLILINITCLILIIFISFLIYFVNKTLDFYDTLFFLLIFYNVIFYFSKLKMFFLEFTSLASYFSLGSIIVICFFLTFLIKKKIFNRFLFFFIILNYVNIIIFSISINTYEKNEIKVNHDNFFFENEKIFERNGDSSTPNIYFIIMDGMTSLEHASKILKIDYTDHKAYLEKNDFNIVPSRSNYNTTYLSLASIIQLDYVVRPTSPKYYDRNNFWPYLLSKINKKPNLINLLEENNYKFQWYGNMTASCKNYSYNKDFCSSKEFNSTYYVFNSFYANTPLITILRKFLPKLMLSFYGDRIDSISNFINTNDLKKNYNKNYFTLIHHLSPHPPYIFNKDCSIKEELNTSIASNENNGYKDAYLCSLKKIERLIDYLNINDPEGLIIITADHGWNIDKNNTQTIEDLVDERTKIYNSIKVKSECLKDAPLKLDNINSVRLVLGCALNIKPIYKKTEIFYGFQEENKEDYGKIFKLDF